MEGGFNSTENKKRRQRTSIKHPNNSARLDKVIERRLRWFAHVERMPVDRFSHKARFVGEGNTGRPRLRRIDNITRYKASPGLIKGSNGFVK